MTTELIALGDTSRPLWEVLTHSLATNSEKAYRQAIGRFDIDALGGDGDHERAARWLLVDRNRTHQAAYLWRAKQEEEGASPASINQRLAAIGSIVRTARQLGLVVDGRQVDWKLDMQRPTVMTDNASHRGPGQEWLTTLAVEIRKGQDWTAARNEALYLGLLFGCGWRVMSALDLQMDGLDLERGEVRTWFKGKERGRFDAQTALIPPHVCRMLATYLAVRPNVAEPTVFLTRELRPMGDRYAHRELDRLCASAGIVKPPRALHGLRHACARNLLDHSVPIQDVSRALRHSSPTITAKYYDDSGDQRARAALSTNAI